MRTAALFAVFLLLAAPTRPVRAQVPRPSTLAELVASADQRNPSILAARQAVAVAEARVLLARAGRGPVVTASGTASEGGTTTT